MITTTDDITQTRRNPGKLSMRFPVDEETTRRLKRVISAEQRPVRWWRRLLRRLRILSS